MDFPLLLLLLVIFLLGFRLGHKSAQPYNNSKSKNLRDINYKHTPEPPKKRQWFDTSSDRPDKDD